MPRIFVVGVIADHRAFAGEGPDMLWSERVDPGNLTSLSFRQQLLERICQAVEDADPIEYRDSMP